MFFLRVGEIPSQNLTFRQAHNLKVAVSNPALETILICTFLFLAQEPLFFVPSFSKAVSLAYSWIFSSSFIGIYRTASINCWMFLFSATNVVGQSNCPKDLRLHNHVSAFKVTAGTRAVRDRGKIVGGE